MNVKQLKKKIQNLPDHMDVVLKQVNNDEFEISPAETAKVKTVTYYGEKEEPKVKCLLITDEI
jgi:hypothetical protein